MQICEPFWHEIASLSLSLSPLRPPLIRKYAQWVMFVFAVLRYEHLIQNTEEFTAVTQHFLDYCRRMYC